ncbi:MAG: hypothetical protein HFE76_15250 [Firmicutes bacterium]|nr:hypothetical protein [Bacillota bacterium]
MDLKDFTDLGNDIGRRVNDAVYNRNFDQLNRDIRNKVNQAFGGGNGSFDRLNGKLYHGEEPDMQQSGQPGGFDAGDFKLYQEEKRDLQTTSAVPVAAKIPGKVSGIIMMVTGYTLAGTFGFISFIMGLLGATMSTVGTVPSNVMGAIAGGMIPPFLAGVVLAIIGTKRYGLVKRFRKYLSAMQDRTFCAIRQLSGRIGKSQRFVAKDLSKMIDKGFFLEGHIDDQKTCFIGTDEMYAQYVQARDSAAEAARKPKEAEPDIQAQTYDDETDAQLNEIIREGESYIETIREANDAIYDPVISDKLYRMERVVKKIFAYVKENPEQMDQLRRFMSYYMPTTEKLVNAYRQMDEQSLQGENITKAKEEISQTLDTINEAYEKLYDSMYVDVAIDVSSDIAVLKTLFAQEGLTRDKMNGGNKG